MSDEQNAKQDALVPLGERGLITQSSGLVKRGLELIGGERVVHFPCDYSVGILLVHDLDHPNLPDQRVDACSDVVIRGAKRLHLLIRRTTPLGLSFLSKLEPNDIQELNLYRIQFGEDDWQYIEHLTGLQKLVLFQTNMSDAGLRYIRQLSELSRLDLSITDVTDAGVEHIQNLKMLY